MIVACVVPVVWFLYVDCEAYACFIIFWHFYFQSIVFHSYSYSIFNCYLTLFDGIDVGIMIERIGIGAGLGLDLNPGQGVDLSIDQGHVRVLVQRGEFLERSLTYSI